MHSNDEPRRPRSQLDVSPLMLQVYHTNWPIAMQLTLLPDRMQMSWWRRWMLEQCSWSAAGQSRSRLAASGCATTLKQQVCKLASRPYATAVAARRQAALCSSRQYVPDFMQGGPSGAGPATSGGRPDPATATSAMHVWWVFPLRLAWFVVRPKAM